MTDSVLRHLEDSKAEIQDRLFEYLRIPSVSTDPSYEEGMRTARELLKTRLNAWGFRNVQELDAGGHPCVYGEWLGAGDKPTLLIYGHYDVQPPDPVDLWDSPAFEPTIRDGNLYARGVSDDKGPSTIALETLRAFLAVEGKLPINVKLLLEGEEEMGSATLEANCLQHSELLAADAVLSADGARWRADLPTINIGSRGNCGLEFTVTTSNRDLHSGRFGGAVPNALHVAADLLASLHGLDGSINVAGFFENVPPVKEEERDAFASLPFDEQAFFKDLEATAYGETGYTTLERLWLRPTIEVNGMWGGYTGPGTKTVLPNEAHAKLTMRLVPGQKPDRIIEVVANHLKQRCPQGVDIQIAENRGGAEAYEVPKDLPLLLAAEQALEQTTGQKPRHVKVGSTLPLSDIIHRCLGLHTVMFSFSTADENFHSPNEFMRLGAFDEGFAAWVALLRKLGED